MHILVGERNGIEDEIQKEKKCIYRIKSGFKKTENVKLKNDRIEEMNQNLLVDDNKTEELRK